MSNRKFRRALFCAAASVGLCSSAYSQTSTWTHAGNGTFNVAANWVGGVPGTSGAALFNLAITSTVTFNADATNAQFNVTAGTVTFTSSGTQHIYTQSSSDGVTAAMLTLSGISVSDASTFNVQNNATLVMQSGASLSASNTNETAGTIDVIGSSYTSALALSAIGSAAGVAGNFVLQNNSAGTLGFTDIGGSSNGAIGSLSVLSGSSLTTASVVVASENLTGNIGGLSVSSATGTSTITQTGASTITIGSPSQGAATLSIGAGGIFTSGTGTFLLNTTGTVDMSGGTLNLNTATVLINGNFKQTGGAISLANGERFTIQNGGAATFSSALNAPAGGTFTITGANSRANLGSNPLNINAASTGSISAGGSLTCGSINVGTAGAGTSNLTVDAATIGGIGGFGSSVGANGSAGQLTLQNGANVTLPASLTVAGTGPNSFGLVTINGSSLSTGNLFVGDATGTGIKGEVDLTGTNPNLTLSGLGSTIGSFVSGGAGTVAVNSGTLNIGGGQLLVNFNGTLSVNGGAFVNNAGFLLVEGKVNFASGNYLVGATSSLELENGGVATFSSFASLAGTTIVTGTPSALHLSNGFVPAGGILNVEPGGFAQANSLTFGIGGEANLDGGTLSVDVVDNFAGGTFNFNAGTLILTASQTFNPVAATVALGPTHTLLPGRNLIFPGTCTLASDLTIDGGNLAVGNVDSGGTLLSLKTGTFSLNSTTLTVGTNGQLGNTLTIGPNMTVNTHLANVGTNGLVVVNGGVFSASVETFVNPQGEINLTSPSATLSTPGAQLVNSGGLIHGTGQVLALVTNNSTGIVRASTGERLVLDAGFANSGTMSLLGGEIDSLVPSINQNGGVITGRGSMLFHGLTNANTGTIALSAGLSDFTGTLTNNGTVIITGGGTATFYDAVANGINSQFRVSTNSTAVFLGNVTGLSAFTGNGIKDFEGSASAGPILTSGSSIVAGGSSLAADSIREVALNVIGSGKITPNGTSAGTSRVQSLTIDGTTDNWDGKLDLSNNAMIVDYTGASPIATIANQIKSAFHGGDWQGNGITSSTANNFIAHPTALGYAEASAVGFTGSFLGQSTDSTSVLIRYVFSGDANLDGVVNALDFNAVAGNFGSGGKFWNDGDFNYDGVTGTADFTTLAQNFSQTLPAPALGSVVPEPAMTLVLWVLFPRRRRTPRGLTRIHRQ